jgi:hypothetical protein
MTLFLNEGYGDRSRFISGTEPDPSNVRRRDSDRFPRIDKPVSFLGGIVADLDNLIGSLLRFLFGGNLTDFPGSVVLNP